MNSGGSDRADFDNKVGPVLRAGELADAIVQAMLEDNEGRHIEVIDKRAYLRVEAEGECVVHRKSIERHIGRPFRLQEIETVLGSFSGQIETTDETVRFYFTKTV
jgi:toluene monooxygenase system protein D